MKYLVQDCVKETTRRITPTNMIKELNTFIMCTASSNCATTHVSKKSQR